MLGGDIPAKSWHGGVDPMIPSINGFEVSRAIRGGDTWRYLPEAIVPSGNLSKNEAQ
jgi:hypothetical protein